MDGWVWEAGGMPRARVGVGEPEHWKIRVGGPGWVVHLASDSEPSWHGGAREGVLRWSPSRGVSAGGVPLGDEVGFIDWSGVVAVTWRHFPAGEVGDDG